MELKDKINNMPAWKFFILVLIGISMLVYCAEEIVIGKVFGFANRIVDSFEVQAIEDKNDIDNELADIDADNKRIRAESRAYDEQLDADLAADDKRFKEDQRIEAEADKDWSSHPDASMVHSSEKK